MWTPLHGWWRGTDCGRCKHSGGEAWQVLSFSGYELALPSSHTTHHPVMTPAFQSTAAVHTYTLPSQSVMSSTPRAPVSSRHTEHSRRHQLAHPLKASSVLVLPVVAMQVWPQAVADTSGRYGNITSTVVSAGGPAADQVITAIHILGLPTSNSAGSSSAGSGSGSTSAGGTSGSGNGEEGTSDSATSVNGNAAAGDTSSNNTDSNSGSGSGGRRLLQGASADGGATSEQQGGQSSSGGPTVTFNGVTLQSDEGKVTFDSTKGVLKIEGLRDARAGQPLNIAWQL